MEKLILKLFEIEAIKFGSFQLKSGLISPIYLDLRQIISYPDLLKEISSLLFEKVKECSYDLVCGVPYTALPLATALSIEHQIPMILRRKEAKDYGTKKLIEGKFCKGQRCLIIEDVVTSGTSVLETIKPLEDVGIAVKDVVVIVDREQGGRERLEERGYRLHSLFTLSSLLQTLHTSGKIAENVLREVLEFADKSKIGV